MILRLDETNDHRELPTSSGGNIVTFKATLSKDHLVDVTVTKLDADTYVLSPAGPLLPGEYLLTSSPLGAKGFDFGFHAENEARTPGSAHE